MRRTLVHTFTATAAFLMIVSVVEARTPTFDERVAAQTAVEEIYWSHRVWPAANPAPKPSLSAVMPSATIRARVEDTLRKSSALADLWHRAVTAKQLQAELDRMIAHSHDPRMLQEIFDALGNDPSLIAETLARQALADRLVRDAYAFDDRFHGALRAAAQAASAGCHDVACMKTMGGTYRETVWQRTGRSAEARPGGIHGAAPLLDEEAWSRLRVRLAAKLGGTPEELPLKTLGPLEETAEAFVVTSVLAQTESEVTTAATTWRKTPFDAWWAEERTKHEAQVETFPAEFTLSRLDTTAGCTPDTWSAMHIEAPEPLSQHTAVWTGAEMIVWGGYPATNAGGRYNPATDTWVLTSMGANVPSPRLRHTAVWTGSEMIIWGGDGTTVETNTGGRYNPATDTWVATSTGANVPAPRDGHTAVWTGTEMIVWGGFFGMNTGGRYNPSTDTWNPTSTGLHVPVAGDGHTAVWTGTEMIVWGGADRINGGYVNTGGRYDPANDKWATTSTGGKVPTQRQYHSAVWTGSEMIVFGGESWVGTTREYVNTGGRYNPRSNHWTATPLFDVPRAYHSAVWTGTEMIVWGGSYFSTPLQTGGRYNPATNTWTATATGGAAPMGRTRHTAVWTGTEMIVWGGIMTNTAVNTGGHYDPVTDSWVATSTGTTGARANHTAVWTGMEMLVWGGQMSDGTLTNTGGRYIPATDTWTPTATGANVPQARGNHTAVWTGNTMIVWGGDDAVGFPAGGGRYDPATDAWQAASTSNQPAPRYHHTAVWTGTEMIVWGGWSGDPPANTGGRYNPVTDTWVPVSTTGAVPPPTTRQDHTAVWTGSEMIVWGGKGTTVETNTGGRYKPATDSWSLMSAEGAPAARWDHTAVWTGAEMIVWGGAAGNVYLGNGGRYNPSTDTWVATSIGASAPAGRWRHTAIWTGEEMILWGGFPPFLSTGARYSSATDTWTATSTGANLPKGRIWHTATWTGSQMVVWGGYPTTATGGLYCVASCTSPVLWYQDHDGDGYGNDSVSILACTQPSGFTPTGGDCDDSNAAIHPGTGLDARPDLVAYLTGATLRLSWTSIPEATGYDVVAGSLGQLHGSGGDFTSSTTLCLGNDLLGSTAADTSGPPAAGEGVWYLVRAVSTCSGDGSYDEDPGLDESRDPEIAASPQACP